MQLHDLTPAPGSTKNRKRVGRGNSSGHGTTSGRGQKGQGSRSGGTKGAGFEGGQTPLAMRLPKLPGFRNPRRIEYTAVNVERLERKFEDGAVALLVVADEGQGEAPLGVILAAQQAHPEDLGVEGQRSIEVADAKHGVKNSHGLS